MQETNAVSQVQAPPSTSSIIGILLPAMGIVFSAFMVIGLAMPVLPLHVSHDLGLGAFAVGTVAGSQFTAALLTRMNAGHFADSRGGKKAMLVGLAISALAGLLYLTSFQLVRMPVPSLIVLLLGRAMLGAGESFILTGALSWGMTLAGHENAGKVIACIGTAMYAAFAAGAPAGTFLYERFGFASTGLATILIPAVTLLFVQTLRDAPPASRERPSFRRVIGAIWVPGIGLALSSMGFGAVITFIVLLFAQKGWSHAWLAFTLLSVAFIGARIFLGHLPDRMGARIALICLLIEALGQIFIWLAHWPAMAFLGAALTGFGYSLVYPGFAVEAVRRVPPENKGLAMGAYTAFLDLALGIAGPVLGLMAAKTGITAIFLTAAVIVLTGSGVALHLMANPPTSES